MRRRFIALVAAASLLVAALPLTAAAQPPAHAQAKGHTKVVDRASNGVYIVHVQGEPAVAYDGGVNGLSATAPAAGSKIDSTALNVQRYIRYLTGRHDELLAGAGVARGNKLYSYTYSLNAFAAKLTHSQALKLAATAGVAAVEPDRLHKKVTENSPDFLGLNDVSGGLAGELGLKGEDVIVGVIDSGIWPEHPSFSDQSDLADRPGASGKRLRVYDDPPKSWHGACQGGEGWSADDCNNKLIGARYFLKGFEMFDVVKLDYRSARDADGHGSHTASTAAGNAGVEASIFGVERGTVSGIAPRARIAAYKGLWNDQGGFTSDLAAAIDAAVADGVDVINYSIGSDTPGYTSADAIAFLNATQRNGVFAAVASGNAGPGAGTVGAPAAAPWVMTVGASTQNRTFEGSVVLGDGSEYTGAAVTPGTNVVGLVDSEDVAAAGADPDEAELCFPGALDPAKVEGKIVLCLRGVNARVEKSEAVHLAGGAGMVLYNPNDIQALVTDNHWVPSVHINFTDGSAIKSYINSAGPAATARINGGEAVPAQGSVMADFSSRGPNGADDDLLKPDVTAPGVNILAGNTPTPFLGAPGELFQSISGTSMSSPHVAGLAALLKEAHPTWDADAIKSALMTTARQDVVKEDGTTPADSFDFGAGHVVPNSAVDPGVVLSETRNGFLAYLCEATSLVAPAACDIVGSKSGFDLNLPSIAISSLVGSETVSRTFTSVADGTATWTPSVEGLAGFDVTLPGPVVLASGASASWDVTFTVTTADFDAWVHGAIVWTDDDGRAVRIPVVLQATQLGFPAAVEATLAGADGTVEWDVKSGYDGVLAADGYGLAADTALLGESVAQDPDQDIETDTLTDGVKTYPFSVTATTPYIAMGTLDATTTAGSDLDVYLLYDENNDNEFEFSELVAFAADGDSSEIVELVNGELGDYLLIVHGWGTPGGGGSTYDLHRWIVDQAAADTGTLVATAGAADGGAVAVNDVVGIDAVLTGLVDPGQYRGLVTYRDVDSELGSTVLIVNR